ncbi:hypothetical protein NQ317_002491 [Molorchus minor]|uniref:Uncharacterized protein n=1 Tax=Molorchus minor TaxID=1323400 RepID=A0ABQ9JAQ0_9CUCU|nr:hypothetical protein NQ317_002491 [Molorchus minor]
MIARNADYADLLESGIDRMKAVIVLLAVIALTFADELSNCKCQEGYEAKIDKTGNARCYGILLKAIMPCNTTAKPRCVCGPEATAVTSDERGTFLWKISRGKTGKENGAEPVRLAEDRMKPLMMIVVLIAVAVADELSDCKCREGYVPTKDESGAVSCYGTILKIAPAINENEKSILPCNVVIKPECKCNEEATSVVQDGSGTWCGKFNENGTVDRRWPCENKEDWEAFYKEHPEEKL